VEPEKFLGAGRLWGINLHPVVVKEMQFFAQLVGYFTPFEQPRISLVGLEFGKFLAVYKS
jgi:hypothetical protein